MLLHRFRQQLKEVFHLQPQHCRLLLAVSGGLDSVVLTDLVSNTGYDFVIAHCNFQLRAAESDRDEAFVKTLGDRYGKEVLVKKFDTKTYAETNKLAIQEAARELRYVWFAEIVNSRLIESVGQGQSSIVKATEQENIHHSPFTIHHPPLTTHHSPLTFHLVTAHHANDNIETSMMHFFRGTGLHGLTGIPDKDETRKILRPLLFAKREEILAYAQTNALAWMEDSSNLSDKYTRNFFRLQLLPEIKKVYPNVEDNLLHNIQRLKEAETLYHQSVSLHKKKLFEVKGNEIHIPVLKLKQAEPLHTITWEIIKTYSFSAAQTDEVIKLLNADNGSYIASNTHRIIKNRKWIVIAPRQATASAHVLIEKSEKKVHFENGLLLLDQKEISNQQPTISNNTATLDAKNIRFPLLLRKWKQGDYFYPLGMQKKKKLSKFFIDNKLSKTEKEKVWVIESDKKILWIIGYRIDDRFKIVEKTKQILRIQFTAIT